MEKVTDVLCPRCGRRIRWVKVNFAKGYYGDWRLDIFCPRHGTVTDPKACARVKEDFDRHMEDRIGSRQEENLALKIGAELNAYLAEEARRRGYYGR